MILYYAGALVTLVLVAALAAYLRLTFAPAKPATASRPLDPSGGFATGDQLRASLSREALLAAAPEVRPSLSLPHPAPKRRGLFRRGR